MRQSFTGTISRAQILKFGGVIHYFYFIFCFGIFYFTKTMRQKRVRVIIYGVYKMSGGKSPSWLSYFRINRLNLGGGISYYNMYQLLAKYYYQIDYLYMYICKSM